MNILKPKNPLLQSISSWMGRTFADPGASSLFFTIVIALLMVEFFGQILTPILVSVAIAYMLSGLIEMLTRRGCPQLLAFGLMYSIFLALIIGMIAVLLPMLIKQLTNMINELPNAILKFKAWLDALSHAYPKLVGPSLVTNISASMQSQLGNAGKTILSFSVSSLGGLITVGLYVLLVPLMVFFFLKDKKQLLGTLSEVLPKNRSVLMAVSAEVNYKIGQYIRGRVIEIVIISLVSMITFLCFGQQYAVLLGVIVGLSVIIPYVGAVIAAVPVIMMSLVQWGFSWEFAAVNIAFWVIIGLDANILVPLLFAGVLDLSPSAIILSVLFFGDIWGFWGVFLSIPLASVVKAIWTAWPRTSR
jgi:putative permease